MKTSIDIAIIGAGPQALTLVTHLLQKKKSMRNRLMVFDPSGRWMQQWYHQFSAFQIPHLRSPSPHHPHPNPQALRNFGEHRRHEFFPPYDLPGTQPPSVPPIRGDVRGVDFLEMVLLTSLQLTKDKGQRTNDKRICL